MAVVKIVMVYEDLVHLSQGKLIKEYGSELVGVDTEHGSQQHGSGWEVKMFDRKKVLTIRKTKHGMDLTVICDKGLDTRASSLTATGCITLNKERKWVR